MRKLLSVLVLVLVFVAGCDSGTGPDNSFTGTYNLETVNGNRVPYVLFQVGNDRVEVVSGTVTINADGTFSARSTVRITESGRTITEEDGVTGTYTRNENAFTFSDSDGDSYTGSLQGNTLTMTAEGLVLVYRK